MKEIGRIENGKYVSAEAATKLQKEEFQRMLDNQQPPRIMTDDVFLSGIGTLDQQIPNDAARDYICRTAKQHGYTPKHTDYYMPSMARFAGDPEAFFNHGQGRGRAQDIVEQRGASAEGAISSKGREPEEDPHENPVHKLNPKIVKRIADQKIKENPDLARMDKRDLASEIVAQHGPKK